MTRCLWFICVLFAVTACGSVPPVPTDHFYRLTLPAQGINSRHVTSDVIHIGNFNAQGLYNERALLYTTDPGGRELQQHRYHFWVTSPPHLLRDYLVEFLRAADSAPVVVAGFSRDKGPRISGRILEFEYRTAKGTRTVNLGLELRVDRRGEDVPVIIREYRWQEPVAGNAMDDIVAAFNRALTTLYNEFLQDIPPQAEN